MAENPSIVEQFDAQYAQYGDFCERIEVLLRQLLEGRGILFHSVSARVKPRGSFIKKIGTKGAAYRALSDVTDIAGVRVITYFADQVDEVARVIEDEFSIDAKNSIDKRLVLDPDRFGYLSLHYVASLSPARCSLAEYRSFNGLKLEIQIRSILQHAWAEIEHDLGYKTSGEVPRSVRRQFARLAGLLELVDSEFIKIRSDLDAYSREVTQRIAEQPTAVGLDRISLADFVRTDPLVSHLDETIARDFDQSVEEDEDAVARHVDKLKFFGLQTIADVKAALKEHQSHIVRLSAKWAQEDDEPPEGALAQGISVFYLCTVLAGATQDLLRAVRYFEAFQIGPDAEEIAQELIDFMKKQTHL